MARRLPSGLGSYYANYQTNDASLPLVRDTLASSRPVNTPIRGQDRTVATIWKFERRLCTTRRDLAPNGEWVNLGAASWDLTFNWHYFPSKSHHSMLFSDKLAHDPNMSNRGIISKLFLYCLYLRLRYKMTRRLPRTKATQEKMLVPSKDHCEQCGQLLWIAEHKHRTITTLDGVWKLISVIRWCNQSGCLN